MNSLSNGFLYVVGLTWAIAEVSLRAVAGNHLPILLFLLVFILAFSILGCIRLSDAAVSKAGAIFAALLALALVVFSVQTVISGEFLFGGIKLIGSGVFVLGALAAFQHKADAHAAHHH